MLLPPSKLKLSPNATYSPKHTVLLSSLQVIDKVNYNYVKLYFHLHIL
jgi:hypothetical protein